MSNYQDPAPRNDAERAAADDAEITEEEITEESEFEQPVVVCAFQAGGLWLVEPHAGEDDDWSVSFPMFEWDMVTSWKLAAAVEAYIGELFPEIDSPHIELKTFAYRRGKVFVARIDLPSNLDKSVTRKATGGQWPIRWYNSEEAEEVGSARMSQEEEWQKDLLKKIIKQKNHG